MYVWTDTLLLADVFENLRNMFLEIYKLDLVKFYLAPGLAQQADLRRDQSEIGSFNWYQYIINGRKRYKRRNM